MGQIGKIFKKISIMRKKLQKNNIFSMMLAWGTFLFIGLNLTILAYHTSMILFLPIVVFWALLVGGAIINKFNK